VNRVVQVPRQAVSVLEPVFPVVDEVGEDNTQDGRGPGGGDLVGQGLVDGLEGNEPEKQPGKSPWDENQQRADVGEHLLYACRGEVAPAPQPDDLDHQDWEQENFEDICQRFEGQFDVVQVGEHTTIVGVTPISNISRKYGRDIVLLVVTLRQRNRLNAMRLTQRTALPMFVRHGFDDVTVGEIANAVEMAPSTLYRHFDTKEHIVLWDEHDVAIGAALESALGNQPPLIAIRDVFLRELGTRYDADLDFQLGRIQYIYATKQLHAAAGEADYQARTELAAGLQHHMSNESRAAAATLAGAALVVLDIAIDRWQHNNAETPLTTLIASGFADLEHLGDLR